MNAVTSIQPASQAEHPKACDARPLPPFLCMHVWLAGRADLLRLFQRTLFRQADPVPGDAVRFLYTLLSTPPCERRYA